MQYSDRGFHNLEYAQTVFHNKMLTLLISYCNIEFIIRIVIFHSCASFQNLSDYLIITFYQIYCMYTNRNLQSSQLVNQNKSKKIEKVIIMDDEEEEKTSVMICNNHALWTFFLCTKSCNWNSMRLQR